MRFVFVETSLEKIPREILNHPDVLRSARRRGKEPEKIILDDSIHHRAMKSLKMRSKRGRPDIIHQCLLSLLDSNLEKFDTFIHTVNREIIWINRETRIPRNYNRFVGLMEDLFEKGIVKAKGDKLMEVLKISLSDILTENTVVMQEGYDEKNLVESISQNLTVCIGAFPHGSFCYEVMEIFKRRNAKFSGFGEKPKTSLYATYKTVCMHKRFS